MHCNIKLTWVCSVALKAAALGKPVRFATEVMAGTTATVVK